MRPKYFEFKVGEFSIRLAPLNVNNTKINEIILRQSLKKNKFPFQKYDYFNNKEHNLKSADLTNLMSQLRQSVWV